MIAQSSPFFPTRTGEEFSEFLKAAIAGELGPFLGTHPAALASVQAPKPTPASFAREKYWAVNAMRFVDGEGKGTSFRYQLIPEAGVEHLDVAVATEKGADFLHEELTERLAKDLWVSSWWRRLPSMRTLSMMPPYIGRTLERW